MNHLNNVTGFHPADVLLPKEEYLERWCVPPVDQHTSETEFWEKLEREVGGAPSALSLVLPEAYLGSEKEENLLASISGKMREYLARGVFREEKDSYIWIEREQSTGKYRRGLLGKIDLSLYDFDPSKKARIRATEETVPSRLPPRIRVREGASLEFPHVLVLYDDPGAALQKAAEETIRTMAREPLYDFRLPVCGHRIRGTLIRSEEAGRIEATLGMLLENSFLAVGDGNHSLAAAKALYEKKAKDPGVSDAEKYAARFALVELVSCEDEAMPFEPIHRLVFSDPDSLFEKAKRYTGEKEYCFTALSGGKELRFTIGANDGLLPVAVLQKFLDREGFTVDYIHDAETLSALAGAGKGIGILLPPFEREKLFPTVAELGVLPRKTFSLGRAEDKRFYLEGRRIR